MTNSKTIVLIAGGGLGAWAWRRVLPELRAEGCDAHALTLTGLGDRAHLAHRGLDLSAWVEDVVAAFEAEEWDDVLLVGHSFSGTVITAAAERLADRIARLVYLDGLVLQDGRSVFDALPDPAQAEFFEALAAENDGWRLPWFTDEQFDTYYGDHALTEEDRAWLRRHAAPHPIATYRERVALGNAAAAALPRTYVRCLGTPGPGLVARGEAGWEFEELATGHWPMVSAPGETAALLGRLAGASG